MVEYIHRRNLNNSYTSTFQKEHNIIILFTKLIWQLYKKYSAQHIHERGSRKHETQSYVIFPYLECFCQCFHHSSGLSLYFTFSDDNIRGTLLISLPHHLFPPQYYHSLKLSCSWVLAYYLSSPFKKERNQSDLLSAITSLWQSSWHNAIQYYKHPNTCWINTKNDKHHYQY